MPYSGRYFVKDLKTGRTFCVEPIHERNEKETDRVFTNGGYDGTSVKNKSQSQGGSISEDESIITPENGFKNIVILPPGESPNGYIESILAQS